MKALGWGESEGNINGTSRGALGACTFHRTGVATWGGDETNTLQSQTTQQVEANLKTFWLLTLSLSVPQRPLHLILKQSHAACVLTSRSFDAYQNRKTRNNIKWPVGAKQSPICVDMTLTDLLINEFINELSALLEWGWLRLKLVCVASDTVFEGMWEFK